jgi:hypothetical protein
MATYFVVGGGTGGTVNLSDATFFSLTSGGPSAGVLPQSGDDVIINTASGTNFFVTGYTFSFLKSFTCGASATPIFNGVTVITDTTGTVATSFALVATCSFNEGSYNNFQFYPPGAAVTCTVNFAGVNLRDTADILLGGNGAGVGTVSLGGAIVNAQNVVVAPFTGNTFSTANNAISTTAGLNRDVRIDAGSTGIVNLGASTITSDNIYIAPGGGGVGGTINLNSATLIAHNQMLILNNATVNANTSTVRMLTTATYPSNLLTVVGGTNLNIVQMQGDKNAINTAGTIATLTKTTNATINGVLELQSDITVTGTATFTGNSVINRLLVTSQNLTSPYTLSAATTSITNTDFRDITAAGAAAWTGTSVGNWLGNTGITFTPAVTRFAVAVVGSVDWTSTAIWSATSGGAGGATVPLAQDNAVINNLSGSGELRVTNTNAMCADLTVGTGYAGSLIINRSAYVFGSITTANEINVTRSLPETITLASRGTVNLSYGNQTLLDVFIQGPATTNINSNIGSPSFLTNRFLVTTGTFNTNGFTVYTDSLVNGGGTIALGSSEIFAYGTCTLGTMSSNTASIFLMNSAVLGGTNLNNVNIAFTTAGQALSIASGSNVIYGTITDRNPNYPATQNYSYGSGSVTFTTDSIWDLANGSGRVVTFSGTNFINNSTRSLQTLTATFTNCTASGTFSGADFNAFGLANFGGNTGITFPSKIKTYAFYNNVAQSFTIPEDYSDVAIITAIGGGGAGVTGSGGGGGGAYAFSRVTSYTKNQTVFISNSTPGNDAWINTINSPPSSATTGALAKAGSSGTIRLGGSASLSRGNTVVQGGNGGTGIAGGGGGGSSATPTTSRNGGNGGNSRTANNGAGGGGGITGAAINVSSQSGTAGGAPNGGTAGVGGASSTAGGNATLNSGGGGGGAGGGYSATTVTKTGTYSRASASTTLVIDITNHQMISGQSYQYTFTPFVTGTYSKPSSVNGSPVTITTAAPHGLTSGQIVYLDFTSGNATSRDGNRTVTVTGLSTFTVTIGLSLTASGNVNLLPALPISSFTTTVINPDQVSITTTTNCPIPATAVSALAPNVIFDRPGLRGGDASYRPDYTFDYLNGAEISGTTGPSGGSGGGSASVGFNGGDAGNFVGLLYAAGGGGGSGGLGVVNGSSANGAPALILFTYATAVPPSQGYIIG